MASLELVRDLRNIIGDNPVTSFNETLSDGVNASWRLTNSPIEIASESVFVSGLLQQTQTTPSGADLTEAAIEGEFVINLGADTSLFSAGEYLTLEDEPDPYKFYIKSIGVSEITLNRELLQDYPAGTDVSKVVKNYQIDYDGGIIYFNAAWNAGTILGVKFKYFKHSDKILSAILDAAIRDVSRDIGENFNSGNEDQVSLVLIKAKTAIIEKEISSGASSAIKIKQGSTSLDLTGSISSRARQSEAARSEYQEALLRYLNNTAAFGLGESVVGREGYFG